jgi:hypothetical protein
MYPLLLLFTFGQSNYTYDSDGRKVSLPSFSEQRKTVLVEDGPNGTVTEESVHRRDSQGTVLPPQKIRTITRTGPRGESIVEKIVYEADINGRMALSEKSTVTTRANDQGTRIDTTLEKPSVNGSLQLFEKVASQSQMVDGKEVTNRAIYRPDTTGRLVENTREAIERATVNGETRKTVRTYDSVNGQPVLNRQRQSVAVKNPDGSTSTVVTIYGADAPGRTADGGLKVREQQIISVRPGEGDKLVESIAIRRPELADGRLGKEIKVGERVIEAPKAAAKP